MIRARGLHLVCSPEADYGTSVADSELELHGARCSSPGSEGGVSTPSSPPPSPCSWRQYLDPELWRDVPRGGAGKQGADEPDVACLLYTSDAADDM
eukprot:8715119-Alexandrium_andersonii.AAC.1